MLDPPGGVDYADEYYKFQIAGRRIELTDPIVQAVIEYVAFRRLARRFWQALIGIVIGVAFAGVGVGLFAYHSNATPEPSGQVLRPSPAAAILDLTDVGKERFKGELGATCSLDRIQVVAVSVTNETAEVIVSPTNGCSVARLRITTDDGTVCPLQRVLPSVPPSPGKPGHPGIVTC